MMFYFMMCTWLDGKEPNIYTHDFFLELWNKEDFCSNSYPVYYIAECLDY
jgi:hypothetical protein